MRTSLSLLSLIVCGALHAQAITNITIDPQNPTECTPITITVNGTLPTSGELAGYTPSVNGTIITVTLTANGGSGGNAPFSQELPNLGPFPPGTYTLTVPLIYNGVEVDVVSIPLIIGAGVNPNAGEYNETAVCNSAANFTLISVLGGSPDPGGVWYNPNNQVVNNGQFDPGQSPEGYYTYLFNVQAPCIPASQQVLITYLPNNSSGVNATEQVCAAGDTLVDLFDQLGGNPTPGGTWTAPAGGPTNGFMLPGTDPCGIYTYSVQGIAPCGATSSTVNIQCVQPSNAGTDATLNLCYWDTVENFNATLQGEQPGGVWTDAFGFFVANFNGNVNISLYGPGEYTYSVNNATCGPAQATLTVTTEGGAGQDTCQVGIEDLQAGLRRFNIAPNPARDEVMIELESERMGSEHLIEILNTNGTVALSERLRSNGVLVRKELAIAGLAKGVYMVRITNAQGQALRRLVVN